MTRNLSGVMGFYEMTSAENESSQEISFELWVKPHIKSQKTMKKPELSHRLSGNQKTDKDYMNVSILKTFM